MSRSSRRRSHRRSIAQATFSLYNCKQPVPRFCPVLLQAAVEANDAPRRDELNFGARAASLVARRLSVVVMAPPHVAKYSPPPPARRRVLAEFALHILISQLNYGCKVEKAFAFNKRSIVARSVRPRGLENVSAMRRLLVDFIVGLCNDH